MVSNPKILGSLNINIYSNFPTNTTKNSIQRILSMYLPWNYKGWKFNTVTYMCNQTSTGSKMNCKSHCSLTVVVIYENTINSATEKWKCSHILSMIDNHCSALCIFLSALSCSSILMRLSCFDDISTYVLVKQSPNQYFYLHSELYNDLLDFAILIVWLPCATVTAEPPKHSNQHHLVLLLLLLCFF